MQRGREGKSEFFGMGDPFSNFRGFGLMPRLFGGRDPFDDPFFTRPFGSVFQSSRFEPQRSATDNPSYSNGDKGVVIEELPSDDEGGKEDFQTEEQKNNSHAGSSVEPSIEHPDDDDASERKSNNAEYKKDYSKTGGTEPVARNFSFQTCKVTYGGVDGAYYTSTRTRRADTDGVVIEDSKEADKITGQATHRISRGIQDKGHSVTRKLNSDGNVDTMQTLHNMNEDELTGFEEAWKSKFNGQLLNWNDKFGTSSSEQNRMASWGRWALPSIEQSRNATSTEPRTNSTATRERTKKIIRINIE